MCNPAASRVTSKAKDARYGDAVVVDGHNALVIADTRDRDRSIEVMFASGDKTFIDKDRDIFILKPIIPF
jgi:hypothetical protein